MNEKIKLLYEQARDYASTKTNIVEDWQWFFDKKFAELIVRECAEYITEYFPHSRYEARQMKKHFGVEE